MKDLPDVGAGRSKKIDQFLKKKLDKKYYDFWINFTNDYSLPFHRASSSTGKYHRDSAGKGHSIEDHTFEMLYCADRIISLFGDTKKQQRYEEIMLAISLHDIHKYGLGNERKHTTNEHDTITASLIRNHGQKHGLSKEEAEFIAYLVENHSGRWSPGNPSREPITFSQELLFIHICDMYSSRRCFKID
jgi:hypothetical protein